MAHQAILPLPSRLIGLVLTPRPGPSHLQSRTLHPLGLLYLGKDVCGYVFSFVESFRDLVSLTRSCRAIQDIARRHLYLRYCLFRRSLSPKGELLQPKLFDGDLGFYAMRKMPMGIRTVPDNTHTDLRTLITAGITTKDISDLTDSMRQKDKDWFNRFRYDTDPAQFVWKANPMSVWQRVRILLSATAMKNDTLFAQTVEACSREEYGPKIVIMGLGGCADADAAVDVEMPYIPHAGHRKNQYPLVHRKTTIPHLFFCCKDWSDRRRLYGLMECMDQAGWVIIAHYGFKEKGDHYVLDKPKLRCVRDMKPLSFLLRELGPPFSTQSKKRKSESQYLPFPFPFGPLLKHRVGG